MKLNLELNCIPIFIIQIFNEHRDQKYHILLKIPLHYTQEDTHQIIPNTHALFWVFFVFLYVRECLSANLSFLSSSYQVNWYRLLVMTGHPHGNGNFSMLCCLFPLLQKTRLAMLLIQSAARASHCSELSVRKPVYQFQIDVAEWLYDGTIEFNPL